MRRAIEDAGYVSEQQEELLKQVGALSPQSTMLRELAGSQQDLMNATTGPSEYHLRVGEIVALCGGRVAVAG